MRISGADDLFPGKVGGGHAAFLTLPSCGFVIGKRLTTNHAWSDIPSDGTYRSSEV